MDVSDGTIQRCRICRCFLQDDDLFCANCGTENHTATEAAARADRLSSPEKVATTTIASVYAVQCERCGASMSYDASAQALRCPFCGSTKLNERQDARTLLAQSVIPTEIDRQEVVKHLRSWLAQGFWRPGDTAAASVLASATLVYVPFWLFSATTHTCFTGDESAPWGSRADWIATSGEYQGTHQAVLIQASSVLSSHEVDAVLPFDLNRQIALDQVDLLNAVVEDFRLPKAEARTLARVKLEAADRAACEQKMRDRARNVSVNVLISDMTERPILAPLWIMVYHYQNKPFRVLVNGQTGRTNGTAPLSVAKISAAIVISILAIMLLLGLVLLMS